MTPISIFLSFLLVLTPPGDFICNGKDLTAEIYNNVNASFTVVNDLDDLDEGAFIVLNWMDLSLMIPRTFNNDEISFSDGKWWWSYKLSQSEIDLDQPKFRERKSSGDIEDYKCITQSLALEQKNIGLFVGESS